MAVHHGYWCWCTDRLLVRTRPGLVQRLLVLVEPVHDGQREATGLDLIVALEDGGETAAGEGLTWL